MSQILSKLNSIKNKLKGTVRQTQPGDSEPSLHSDTPAAPTPVLKATLNASTAAIKKKSNAHKHRFIAFMRWLVGNASHVPALAKVLVTAAFFGSVMLVALSIFFLPFPRKKIQPVRARMGKRIGRVKRKM